MNQESINNESINRYRKEGMGFVTDADISHPKMRMIIYYFMQAHFLNDPILASQAENLLDKLYTDKTETMPICLENGILGIGCGLIYLLRNGLVEGEEDMVLSEIDQSLFRAMVWLEDETIVDWYGWLHYTLLRLSYERSQEQLHYKIVIQENTIYLLDALVRGVRKGMKWNESLLYEIQELHNLELCPKITGKLLFHFTSIENAQVTFVIPVRIDSPERELNLDVLLDILSKVENADILILEGDCKPCYQTKKKYANVCYTFVQDLDPVFHRTKYINWLLKKAIGSVVGVWDTDVMIPENQILEAIGIVKTGEVVICYPFDGRCYLLSSNTSSVFVKNISFDWLIQQVGDTPLGIDAHAAGSVFFVNKKIYLQAGGENENFYGWGPEDVERSKRMEILGLPIYRAKGPLYHLYHPRKENSWYADIETEIRNRQEFLTVCSMTQEKLLAYIQSWEEPGCLERKSKHFNINRKQNKEADFWKAEIECYRLWYNGELPHLYNTPAPYPQEKIICHNPVHSYILTWTELHQKPKYLHDLNIGPRQFVGKKVLDVGAGPIPSATCFEDCDLYVLDPLMSVYHKLGFPHELYPNVHFVEAPAERIPFEDNFFDVILSVNAIDHVDNLEQVAKELQRVAKPDSLFLMHVEYHKATICEPIEMENDLLEDLFSWVRNMRIISQSTHSFSSVVDGHGQYVLWGNL